MGGNILSGPERGWMAEIQDVAREGWSWVVQNRWAVAGVILGGGILYWGVTGPRNLPPGPRGLPILGNMLEFSPDLHLDCERWRKKYGDVISLTVFGSYIVFLCNADVTKEAFVTKAELFAHRPPFKTFEIMDIQDDIFCSPYGEKWKANKKFALSVLRSYGFGSLKGEVFLHDQLDVLANHLKHSEDSNINIRPLIEKIAANVIYLIVFSKSWTFDDPQLEKTLLLTREFFNSLEAENGLVGILPFGISKILFKKEVKRLKNNYNNFTSLLGKYLDENIKTFDKDNLRNVVDEYIKERGIGTLNYDNMLGNLMNFTTDPVHTTSCFLSFLIFYMAKYPDVQDRIQDQLDAVIGPGRKVTMKDKPDLPLLDAAIHEGLRLAGPFPIIGSRIVQHPVQVGGYTLPRGAVVLSSVYAFHMDEKTYATPDKFNIDHFLNEDGSLRRNENLMPFGSGRRMCFGEQHAKMFIFVFLANFLLRYQIKFPADFTPPGDMEFNGGLITEPKPFTVNLVERE